MPFLPSALAATLIEHAGTDEQRARWLPGLATGEITGAVGDAREGIAALVPGGAGAAVYVLVEDGDRPPARRRGRRRRARRVDRPDPPGRPRGRRRRAARRATRWTARATVVAAELVGVCTRALEMTVAYVKDRRQFGTPVGAYQAVSHRCAQMLLDTESARAAVSFAAWAADADPARLPEAAAMAKASASDAGRDVTAAAIQLHGGIGFTWEADVHWLFKRAQMDAVLLGGAKAPPAPACAAMVAAERVAAWRSVTVVGALLGERRAGLADEPPRVGRGPQRQRQHPEVAAAGGPRCWARPRLSPRGSCRPSRRRTCGPRARRRGRRSGRSARSARTRGRGR